MTSKHASDVEVPPELRGFAWRPPVEFLLSVGELAAESSDIQRGLLRCGRVETFGHHHVVTRDADTADMLVGMIDGTLMVCALSDAPLPVILQLLRPGDWYARLPSLTRRPPAAILLAAEKSRLFIASGERFNSLLQVNAAHTLFVSKLLARQVDIAARRYADMRKRNKRQRIATLLHHLSSDASGDASSTVELPLSRDVLARTADVTRNTVGAVLRELRDAAIIRYRRNAIVVENRAALRELM